MAKDKAAKVSITTWDKDRNEQPGHKMVSRSLLGPVLHDLLLDEEIDSVIISYKDGSMTSYYPK